MPKSEKNLIRKLLLNQTAIAAALNIKIPYPLSELPDSDPLSLMPHGLRRLLNEEQVQIFRSSFEGDDPLFSVIDGTITYNFSQPVLAAYFFGRLFCGDHPEHCIDTDIWRKGNHPFPNSLITECFANRDYRESRQNKLNKSTPKNAYIVDILFEKHNK